MITQSDLPLAPLTSFKSGGNAESAIITHDYAQLRSALSSHEPKWFLGYGSNSLISDHGLDGVSLLLRGGNITHQDGLIIADAGVWWDDLVLDSIEHQLWGLECTSAIPGGVGAAVVGNIAAYGQAVSDTLEWADIYDTKRKEYKTLTNEQLGFEYRCSKVLQADRSLLVMRAAFRLSSIPSKAIEYESALSVAREKNLDLNTLAGRREAILGAREKAGSLWDYRDPDADKTAGSFFRNPLVDADTATRIMSFDETGKSLELLAKMNQVHGGSSSRVSAAHVLLAAGFQRGQAWGDVRLHPQHVLKIENAGHATSQQIHDVASEIIASVHEKLGVELDPEVRFLGTF